MAAMTAVLLWMLLIGANSVLALTGTVTIRHPDSAPCAEGERCSSLPQCLANSDSCFTSFTTILFDSGDHYTNSIEAFIMVKDVANLTLTGQRKDEVPLARIHCNKKIGFAFVNVTNLQLSGIEFINCGWPIPMSLWNEGMHLYTHTYLQVFPGMQTALLLVHVENFKAEYIRVLNSSGFGLLGWNILGSSSISHSSFCHSNFHALSYHQSNPFYCRADAIQLNVSTCVGGNAAFVFQDIPSCPAYSYSYDLTIAHSVFTHGVNLDYEDWEFPLDYFYPGGGLSVFAGQSSYDMAIWIVNVSIDSNIGYTGANLVLRVYDDSSNKSTNVLILDSTITNGNHNFDFFRNTAYSGGLYFGYGSSSTAMEPVCPDPEHNAKNKKLKSLVIHGCNFSHNLAFRGAAIHAFSIISGYKWLTANFVVQGSRFTNNTGFSAIVYLEEAFVETGDIDTYSLNARYSGNVFEHNTITYESDTVNIQGDYLAVLVFRYLKNGPTVEDCIIQDNAATALYVALTTVALHWDIVIQRNTGVHGGGISIGGNSFLTLGSLCNVPDYIPLNLTVKDNAAIYGGGIYIEDTCVVCRSIRCFTFEINKGKTGQGVHITLIGNIAEKAGNSIYGGHLDMCLASVCNEGDIRGTEVIETIVNYPNNTSLSEITSDPQQVCFCEHQKPACGLEARTVNTYPGALLLVEAVGVGQMNGTVPSVAVGRVRPGYRGALGAQQAAQALGIDCGQLTYRVTANVSYTELEVQVNLERGSQQLPSKIIGIVFDDCPLGFVLDPGSGQCDCIMFLSAKGVVCDLDTQTFRRTAPLWIGYEHNKIMLLDNCPFDYCKVGTVWLSLYHTSAQCGFSRSGILCGQCKPGLSSVFGTSQCKECSNAFLSLLIPFAIAGFLLVVLLMYLDLTVSKGTLNGLIFYANIVRVNHAIIFPPGESNVLTVFIAWLNLDLGIETCFYNGMDEYVRAWLQFIFPVYVWIIVGIIIVASWYSSFVVKITRSNVVAVLATLFLLSYTKLQRTVLTALSLTVIPFHNGDSTVVWLYDGNVPYVTGKHAALFFTAILVAVCFLLPITALVLFGPFLQSKCSHQLMKLRLMPILDAYHGPYKDKFRCWTGVMLVVRSVLLLSFSVNALGNPRLNLLLIVSLMVVLLGFTYNVKAVYKQAYIGVLESFYIVNLILLSAWTEFNRNDESFEKKQAATAYTLISTAFIGFLGILFYHITLQAKRIVHSHNIHVPFNIGGRRSQARDIHLQAVNNEADEPVVNPRVPTVTYIDIRARESLLDTN